MRLEPAGVATPLAPPALQLSHPANSRQDEGSCIMRMLTHVIDKMHLLAMVFDSTHTGSKCSVDGNGAP